MASFWDVYTSHTLLEVSLEGEIMGSRLGESSVRDSYRTHTVLEVSRKGKGVCGLLRMSSFWKGDIIYIVLEGSLSRRKYGSFVGKLNPSSETTSRRGNV